MIPQEREYPTVTSWPEAGLNAGDLVSVAGRPGLWKILRIGLTMDGTAARNVYVWGGEGYHGQPLAPSSKFYGALRIFDAGQVLAAGRSVKGGRQTALVELFQAELERTGRVERPLPEDPEDVARLRGKLYTAGRRSGVPVSVKVDKARGMMVARVKT